MSPDFARKTSQGISYAHSAVQADFAQCTNACRIYDHLQGHSLVDDSAFAVGAMASMSAHGTEGDSHRSSLWPTVGTMLGRGTRSSEGTDSSFSLPKIATIAEAVAPAACQSLHITRPSSRTRVRQTVENRRGSGMRRQPLQSLPQQDPRSHRCASSWWELPGAMPISMLQRERSRRAVCRLHRFPNVLLESWDARRPLVHGLARQRQPLRWPGTGGR